MNYHMPKHRNLYHLNSFNLIILIKPIVQFNKSFQLICSSLRPITLPETFQVALA